MKRFFRIKKKIYRKYYGDIWGRVIIKGQINRTFKFLLEIYRIKQVKSLFFRKKTAIRIRKEYFYRKKINIKKYNPKKLWHYFDFFNKERFAFRKKSNDLTAHF